MGCLIAPFWFLGHIIFISADACPSFWLYIDNLEGGSVDEPVEDGDTALHLACLYGNLSCVQVCFDQFFVLYLFVASSTLSW